MRLHLIYIPGLGDRNPKGQRWAVKTWSIWGVEAELFHGNWGDGQPWEPKFERLLKRIDELASQGTQVALIGASAGAGAVINAYAARKDKVVGCVLICGKVNNPSGIGPRYSTGNPAFMTSANAVPKALAQLNEADRSRIMSIFSIADPIVPKRDSRIPGAHNRYTLIIGHSPTIATQITLGAPGFIWFLKRQARRQTA